MTAAASHRQLKADETRRRIVHAAAELFAREGYRDTSVDKIVKRAGVAKGTFFVHFPTKEAVVTELVRLRNDRVAEVRASFEASAAGPLARLRWTVLAMGDEGGKNRMLTRAVFAATLESGEVGAASDDLHVVLLDSLVRDATEAVRTGELVPETDARAFAGLLMTAYLGAAVSFATSPRQRELIDILKPLVDELLSAFSAKPHAKKKARR